MAISVLQACDNGNVASGSGTSWNMTSNVTAGSAVVLTLNVASTQTISAVSGLGISTWNPGPTKTLAGDVRLEMWYGFGATGGSKAITVTTSAGAGYNAQAYEVAGATRFITSNSANNTSTHPALTLTTTGAGQIMIVHASGSSAYSAAPTNPWVDYNGAGTYWSLADSTDLAYIIDPVAEADTAQWTQTSGVWGTVGLILAPPAASSAGIYEIQQSLNILAYGAFPPADGLGARDSQRAANDWAGTTGKDTLAALNAKNGTTTLDFNKVCNALAGTTGKDAQDALSNLAGGGHT